MWLSDCLEKFPDFKERHEIVVGPALDSLPKITGQFDMVFVDANKSEYKRYVELMLERDLIAPGGTIICDNILYNGYPYLDCHFDAEGPAMKAVREKMLTTNWAEEWETKRTMFSYGVSILRK